MNDRIYPRNDRLDNNPSSDLVDRVSADSDIVMLMKLMGCSVSDATVSVNTAGVMLQRVRAGMTLFHEGAPANAIYFVRMGTFKSYHTTVDGYEQVVSFAGRAELLGFDALCTGRYPTSAVALDEASVYALPMKDVAWLGQRAPDLDRILRVSVSSQLQRYRELADLMSAACAEARLARFLLQLSNRMKSQGLSPLKFSLRMSRRDIASYLGVAHETISRGFGHLAQAGYVAVKLREIEIMDMAGLHDCARGTRRPASDAMPKNGHDRLAVVRSNARGHACGMRPESLQ